MNCAVYTILMQTFDFLRIFSRFASARKTSAIIAMIRRQILRRGRIIRFRQKLKLPFPPRPVSVKVEKDSVFVPVNIYVNVFFETAEKRRACLNTILYQVL